MKQINFVRPKQLAWLIDPDKVDFLEQIPELADCAGIDYFFVGGSLLKNAFLQELVRFLKQHTNIPVILFPGNTLQLVPNVDAVLFLSLISGRNPEFLIGQHVVAAPLVYHYQIPTISVGYILVDSGKPTSVSYLSHTIPIPANKIDIITATALAGQYLGLQNIYLEAGSGAQYSVNPAIVQQLKEVVSVPIWVGGGIQSPEKMCELFEAGANLVVIGTAFEQHPTVSFMQRFKHR
ncbi:MAG: geranylgeranylglyceryl/heptaprenylglyceryl phosphate synthase [Bacteroidia bacterium]|nr:geranylgeranylglyceryl/heptaprenylglyceryl phosphate synthase [Bacteroidia bacterium]MDW8301398.1 geranylgeranylglyceryl/heptaprenylglyceryl phosphate synthase [Bacteroidia bacterium]